MDFDDFETIYALGLDDVVTGEREPTAEEEMLLSGIGAGFGVNGSEPGIIVRILSFILSCGTRDLG